MTIAEELNEVAVAFGGKADTTGTISGAIDALNDALAGSDQPAASTIEGAIALLAEHIGSGGGEGGGGSVKAYVFEDVQSEDEKLPYHLEQDGKALQRTLRSIEDGDFTYYLYISECYEGFAEIVMEDDAQVVLDAAEINCSYIDGDPLGGVQPNDLGSFSFTSDGSMAQVPIICWSYLTIGFADDGGGDIQL